MEKHAFEVMEVAEHSWWYRGRAFATTAVLKNKKFGSALDFGAGFGGMFPLLKKHSKAVYAFEPDPITTVQLTQRGYSGIYLTAEEALSHTYDLIALFDVLEHIEHDADIAKKLHEALNPGGELLITVPAYMWLWSTHDSSHKHFRRYTASLLKKVLEGAGFKIEYLGYWNASLLIPVSIIRFFGGTGEGGFRSPWFVQVPVTVLLWFEAHILRFVRLPFGISVIAKARKL